MIEYSVSVKKYPQKTRHLTIKSLSDIRDKLGSEIKCVPIDRALGHHVDSCRDFDWNTLGREVGN